jgi:hypothetical protein
MTSPIVYPEDDPSTESEWSAMVSGSRPGKSAEGNCNSVSDYPESAAVAELAQEVAVLTGQRRRQEALRHAMISSGSLLRSPTDELRYDLYRKIFKKIGGIGYQGNDFEAVDYDQFEMAPNLPLFRGPAVPETALERGDYLCVVGAAQTFGSLVLHPWPQLLGEAVGLPVLNLSRGGAGPEFFLKPKLIQLARRARFVVLQVMSGRSVGCSEYPGGRRITVDSKLTDLLRLDVLEGMWHKDPKIALHYVRRWNASYLDLYRQLRAAIDRPTLLLWLSERAPDDWKPEGVLQEPDWGEVA